MTSKITNCLWFDGNAREAAEFYAATFPESSVGAIHRARAEPGYDPQQAVLAPDPPREHGDHRCEHLETGALLQGEHPVDVRQGEARVEPRPALAGAVRAEFLHRVRTEHPIAFELRFREKLVNSAFVRERFAPLEIFVDVPGLIAVTRRLDVNDDAIRSRGTVDC